jgi:hypothetical protein
MLRDEIGPGDITAEAGAPELRKSDVVSLAPPFWPPADEEATLSSSTLSMNLPNGHKKYPDNWKHNHPYLRGTTSNIINTPATAYNNAVHHPHNAANTKFPGVLNETPYSSAPTP